jgi:hypothetical protein
VKTTGGRGNQFRQRAGERQATSPIGWPALIRLVITGTIVIVTRPIIIAAARPIDVASFVLPTSAVAAFEGVAECLILALIAGRQALQHLPDTRR